MDRREFLIRSAWMTAGGMLVAASPSLAQTAVTASGLTFDSEFYKRFRNPDLKYHPYFRWWWPGAKVEGDELVRQLRMLKGVGIGGVEINTIRFPGRSDDKGIKSKIWLGDEWIEMLDVTFTEAKKLGMTCDMIVGSGFPFGGEFLEGDERGQMVGIGVKKLKGPMRYDTSIYNLLLEADPQSGHLYSGREHKLLSLVLVPDPMSGLNQLVDLSDKLSEEVFSIDIPEGKHALYLLVRIESFAGVIQGSPGAQGPILNHLNKTAVEKYLYHMSDAIEAKLGPLKNHVRSMFCDSMELAGMNWCTDMPEEFKKRKGYDLMPYLPLIMYAIGSFGNVTDYEYGAKMTPEFRDTLDRVRFDFEEVKAELFLENFTIPFTAWCHKLGIQSRAQGYGRGFFPLETSMHLDIPEAESWTTNWLQHRIGEEMGYDDYRRGRSYTMVNKFVGSGAHLAGKRWVSCEEMTNTYRVFNATLEFLKLGSDMNAITGVSHSIWHGFNYNPPGSKDFPGWIVYGGFYNERNNWWPYFHYLNEYRARLSSVFTNADMFADIAVMPPVYDMWTTMGVQQEPFPTDINVYYYSYTWEALCKNGNGTDYISDNIINAAKIQNGWLVYGPRKYRVIFLVGVERMQPVTLSKLYEFVSSGGTIICVEKEPTMSLGYMNHSERDAEVKQWVEKLKTFSDRFVVLPKPEDSDFLHWIPQVQKRFNLKPYVTFSNPDLFMLQARYRADDGTEMVFITNSHLHNGHKTRITFAPELTRGRYPWIWDPQTGERYRITLGADGGMDFDLSPASTTLVVFDKVSKGTPWKTLPVSAPGMQTVDGPWEVELINPISEKTQTVTMDELKDLKETDYVSFTGTAIYRNTFQVSDPAKDRIINLGKVFGVCDLRINGQECGVMWYGRRIYDIGKYLKAGTNQIEVRVITTMGNYAQLEMKDNPTAQGLTNRPGRPQPIQSMGLAGPVTLYGLKS